MNDYNPWEESRRIIKQAISRTERAKTAPLLRYEPAAEEPSSRPFVVLLVVVAVFGVVLAALNSYYAQPPKPAAACEVLK